MSLIADVPLAVVIVHMVVLTVLVVAALRAKVQRVLLLRQVRGQLQAPTSVRSGSPELRVLRQEHP